MVPRVGGTALAGSYWLSVALSGFTGLQDDGWTTAMDVDGLGFGRLNWVFHF